MDQPNIYKLYYVPTNRMIQQISEIYKISYQLDTIFNPLPPIAKKQFIFESLVEELHNTNQLEGVSSSREEIARSVREIRLNKSEKNRFHSMVKSYLKLINGDTRLPTTPEDIRKIYDNITEGEIDSKELPDGKIFREEATYILKKSGSGKVIHRGIVPESRIHEEIINLLEFLNEERHIPPIIRVAVGHYFFGYIHPFYDGNGRTSRFISSMYLSEELGQIAALSLSRGCNKLTNKYLDSFDKSNSVRNRGEMNFFIENFLEIILEALNEMLEGLIEKDELLSMAAEKIYSDSNILKPVSKQFMFVLAQNNFFHSSQGVTVSELSETLEISPTTVRKIAKELIDLSLVEKHGERPAFYTIKHEYFES